jgi:hypothetical protein
MLKALKPPAVTKLAVILSCTSVLCSAQQQNVGAVGQGVSISFQNTKGSTDRGVSIGFQDASGTVQVTTNVASAAFTLKGPASYTGSGQSFTQANAPAGTYTITYGVVPGFTTPVSEAKTLSAGGTVAFTGSYAPLPGIGRIQVTANLDAASFNVVALTNTPGFTPFSKSGKFYDTGLSVPSGTYQITFAPVSGYFTPPVQTLTLSAGATLPFTGTYRRMIVVLFTGYSDHPTPFPDDGVTYPDVCPPGNCPGMAQLATKLRNNSYLRDGILARAFTFYDVADWLDALNAQCVLTNELPVGFCAWQHAPSNDATHQVAAAWLAQVNPGRDDRIVVIGHSYGGNRARLFAEQLPSVGRSADLLATVDPIDWNLCSIAQLGGTCYQFDDSSTKVKQPSIIDVQSFAQAQSALLMGYHFFDYPYIFKYYPSCGADLYYCAHAAISLDPSVHDAITNRLVALRDDPREPIYGVSASSVGATTAGITWKTGSTNAGGSVIYSQNQDASTNSLEAAETTGAGISHSATISGLVPNTRYYYRIRSKIYGSTNFSYSSIGFLTTGSIAPSIKASNPVLTPSGNGIALTVTLSNSGAPAVNGTMTAGSIGASKATASFPLPIQDLGTGTSFSPNIPFPATLGTSGSTVYPTITVKYSGSTFSIAVPPVKLP